MYIDQQAIEFLARSVNRADRGASSHWREMHSTFQYSGGKLVGLRGFGGYSPRSHWIENAAHRVLQQRWRRMGRAFPGFARIERAAREVARRQGRICDLDVLRQALTLAYVEAHVPAVLQGRNTMIVIGDGYGALASIALAAFPEMAVVTVNLVKTLLADLLFIGRALPDVRRVLATDADSLAQALGEQRTRLIALRADDSALLSGVPAALAVNIASMQEMNPDVIAAYFAALRGTPGPLIFYCCNREEKTLPDGTTVRFADYPWRADDEVLDDALCPWHQDYYTARPPFIRRYDGPLRHRLVRLASLPAIGGPA